MDFDFLNKVKRQNLSGIDKMWYSGEDEQYWKIEVETLGYSGVIKLYFIEEKEMQEVFDKIDAFIFDYDVFKGSNN